MTPAELADQLEDGPGEVRIESVPHMQLLAAALRLAEAECEYVKHQQFTAPNRTVSSERDIEAFRDELREHDIRSNELDRERRRALAAYRAAREGLARIAP